MSLTAGTSIGHYDVTSLLGEGGMGQVWQATDTQLNRQVALKILPDAFAADPDRLARFTREAQILASLNHPGIAAIYGIEEAEGTRALVLELVEGPTLADRIAKGPIPLDEALPIAKQIAEALEAAHEAGVIHRDLKPANIKVREDGTVKVLDFGLAKALDPTPVGDPSQSPTLTAAATQMGVIMGTAAYMSPEQARGKPVDKRADIWAFGAVLYEMLVGVRVFQGDDVSATLARVIEREPDYEVLPATTPVLIRRLLRRCLEKDRRERLRDIGDARAEIKEALTTPAVDWPGTAAPEPLPWWRVRRGERLAWGLAVVLAALVGAAGWSWWRSGASQELAPHLAVTLPADHQLDTGFHPLSVSPDGTTLVYAAATPDGDSQLFRRPLNSFDPQPIPGTVGGSEPFFSPDGEWIGFVVDQSIRKIPAGGGAAVTLVDGPMTFRGASWGDDGSIIFGNLQTGLVRMADDGSSRETFAMADLGGGQNETFGSTFSRFPHSLPGGEAVLYTVGFGEQADTWVLSVETGQSDLLFEGGAAARYVPSGHLVYTNQGELWAVPFDAGRLELSGSPIPIPADIAQYPIFNVPLLTVSDTGTVVSVPGVQLQQQSRLVRVDRAGRVSPLVGGEDHQLPRISPDGSKLIAGRISSGGTGLWLHEFDRGTWQPLTFEEDASLIGWWMPDGTRVLFVSDPTAWQWSWTASDGSGTTEPFDMQDPPSWWAEQEAILVLPEPDTAGFGAVFWVLTPAGEYAPFAAPLTTPFEETAVVPAPGGQWVAYVSDESGQSEVTVAPYPGPGARVRISTDGGTEPVWSADGRELFYRNGDELLAVAVTTSPTFVADTPRPLFQAGLGTDPLLSSDVASYDVFPDGEGFVMTQLAGASTATHLNVVFDWFEELRARVPVN